MDACPVVREKGGIMMTIAVMDSGAPLCIFGVLRRISTCHCIFVNDNMKSCFSLEGALTFYSPFAFYFVQL
jgi:hypothetical protein